MKRKPLFLRIILLVVCVLLVLFAGVLPLMGGTRILGLGFLRGGPGGIQYGPRGDFTPPADGNFQPGQGQQFNPGGNSQGIPPDANSFPGRIPGNFNGIPGQNSTQAKVIQLIQYLVAGAVIFFGALAAIGGWLEKKWGKTMAVITAIVVLANTIPTMLRSFGSFMQLESYIKIGLVLLLVVFAFIPGKKRVDDTTNLPAAPQQG